MKLKLICLICFFLTSCGKEKKEELPDQKQKEEEISRLQNELEKTKDPIVWAAKQRSLLLKDKVRSCSDFRSDSKNRIYYFKFPSDDPNLGLALAAFCEEHPEQKIISVAGDSKGSGIIHHYRDHLVARHVGYWVITEVISK